MHAKPDLCVVLKWMIAGSGSVITDVIPLKQCRTFFVTRRTMDLSTLFKDDRMARQLLLSLTILACACCALLGCKESQSLTIAEIQERTPAEKTQFAIRSVDVLTPTEIESLPSQLDSRLTIVSQEQLDALAHALDQQNKSEAPKEVLEMLVRKKRSEIPVMDLTLVLIDLKLADQFRNHSDPIIRFISNYFLAKSGRLDAGQRLYSLIDDKNIIELDARYLKTRFAAMGIDVEQDTGEDIARYLSNINREFPVFTSGDSLPNFHFHDAQGQQTSLNELRGKTVIFHFWATWCIPCMDELDNLATRLKQLDNQKYEIIFVSLDFDQQAHTDCIANLPKQFRYICDGKSGRGSVTSTFSVSDIPRNVIVSPDGTFASSDLSDLLQSNSRK